MSSTIPQRILALAPILLGLFAWSCSSSPSGYDTTVLVHGQGGDELGVATDLGVVFLGHSQTSGQVDYTVFFGDGPSRERGQIEALSTGLYALQPELRIPTVSIGYPNLAAGDTVILRGHRGRSHWQQSARVASNPRVEGLLLSSDGLGDLDNRDLGAGVYVREHKRLVLIGLLQGRITLPVDGGKRREYIAIAGARELIGLGVRPRPPYSEPVPIRRHDALR